MGVEALVASEFISTAFALVLAYLFSKAYRLTRSSFLLGLPVGFSFLAFSYVFLALSLLDQSNMSVSESFMWLKLVMQSFGFIFIAFAYYFAPKSESKTEKYSFGIILFASVVSIFLLFVVLLLAPPSMGLPSVNVVDEFFMTVNLVFLGYVIWHLVKHFESSQKTPSGFIWTPTAFSLLWLGQYSSLIWAIDRSQTAFIFAHGARITSLILFICIFYLSRRISNEGKC